ncbi:low temperature requirement protein A [Amycolatopsis saalfeldensis]|uniref:low temperature requirement protein A n=1 Tax=Amycolatopsis saalfeldensis TaxID=394193 RepID=UPI000AE1AED8|nr:low temperature requirement protein A [Amycolatopsis saalfeldensis]
MSENPEGPAEERHASWLELFFDLVAVAGVGQLAHLVHGSASWADVGLYVVCFLAFWTAWMCFTVYGNVVGGAVKTMPVLTAMAGLVVMAASVSGIHGDHAKVFAVAYVAVRVLSDRIWEHRGDGARVLVDWPVAQVGFGVTPWLISIWAPGPWRYWLWALGVLVDLVITFTLSGKRLTESVTARLATRPGPAVQATAARLDTAHFGERLGLFTIIVLGEGVLTVTDAMAEAPKWSGPLYWTVFAALGLLATLWGAALREGSGGIGVPRPGPAEATGAAAAALPGRGPAGGVRERPGRRHRGRRARAHRGLHPLAAGRLYRGAGRDRRAGRAEVRPTRLVGRRGAGPRAAAAGRRRLLRREPGPGPGAVAAGARRGRGPRRMVLRAAGLGAR